MKKLFWALTLAALPFLARPADAPLNVVATLPDLAALADQIGGSSIKLSCLANPAEDPHFIDPKPSFVKLLNKADLLIEGGAELEAGWLPPLVQNARNAKILPGQSGRLSGGEGVPLKDVPAGPLDRSQGDVHPAGNPHYLMDPLNAVIVAQKISAKLGSLDAPHAADYLKSAKAFDDEIHARLPEWEKMLAAIKGQKVITYHKSFTYFLDRFGLELFDTIEPKPGIEPSPAHIAGLINRAKAAGIKYILIEENRPRRMPDRLAQEIGAQVVVLHHMPQTAGDARYIAWMRGIVETIQKAASKS
jgi:zinc/manganese transport system substrate-binding protein